MHKKENLLKSFGHAWDGIAHTIIHERNMTIHFVTTLLVIIAGLLFQLALNEWLALLVFLTIVPVVELFNTATEQICDLVRDELYLDYAATRWPRDLAAGAVLYAAIGAVIAGILIFWPHIRQLLLW